MGAECFRVPGEKWRKEGSHEDHVLVHAHGPLLEEYGAGV